LNTLKEKIDDAISLGRIVDFFYQGSIHPVYLDVQIEQPVVLV